MIQGSKPPSIAMSYSGENRNSTDNNKNNNPLLEDFYFPPLDVIRAEHVRPGIRGLLRQLEAQLEELELTVEPTWPKLVEPLEKIVIRLDMVWDAVYHLQTVKDTPELRSAMEEVQPEKVAFRLKLGQSKPIYNAFKAIRDSSSWDSLSVARKRIVEMNIKVATLSGIALEDDKRDRFNQIEQELASLSKNFDENSKDSTKMFEKLIINKKDIEGLPASVLGMAAQTAVTKGHENATAEKGPWIFTLDFSSFRPIMRYAKNRNLREEVYRARVTCASSGDFDNTAIIDQILKLRLEKANLLGYNNYAEVCMENKMATVDEAMELLEKLRNVYWDAAVQDMEDLKQFAKSQGSSEGDDLREWDVPFWIERLRESKYEINEEELRPYFSLTNVMGGLFNLVKTLFGINIEAADGLAPVWDDDVRFYRVDDSSGSAIAYFYFDPYSRPSEKRQGVCWMNDLVSRSRVISPEGVSLRLPVAHIACNQMAPEGNKPSLMTLYEIENVFHEFGHALQHMLTKQDENLVAGSRGIEHDAIELPSQFMENWCYHRNTIMSMAKHYESGESLPENMYQKLLATRTFQISTQCLGVVELGSLDLELHTKYVPGGSESVIDVEHRITEKHQVVPLFPDARSVCSFFHAFAGVGYEAGVYSYKWSEVLSADAFSAFEDVGLDNEKAIQETGRSFRETILGLGGGKAALQVFLEFRGREPSTEALLRHNGLLPVTATA